MSESFWRVWVPALLILSFACGSAFAQGSSSPATLFSVKADGTKRELNWITKSRWGFVTNGEGARVLRFSALLKLPDAWATKGELVTDSTTVEIKHKNNIYLISTGAMTTKLNFKMAGGVVPVELRLAPPPNEIFEEKCKELDVAFTQSSGPKAPFFIGAACTADKLKVKFHLTLPEEASTGQSTLFESKGKGESWRIYDLGEINAATGEIGKFEIIYNDKTYRLSLKSLKKKNADKTLDVEIAPKSFSAGLGYASLSLSNAGKGSGGAIYAVVSALPKPTFHAMGLGGDVGVATPTSSGGTPFSYLRIAPYVFYRVMDTPDFVWDARAFFTFISLSQAASGIGVQASQPAVGLSFKTSQARWTYQLDWMSESLVYSQIVKQQNLFTLGAFRRGEGAHWDFGGALMAESLSATSQSGSTYAYSLIGLYGLLNF